MLFAKSGHEFRRFENINFPVHFTEIFCSIEKISLLQSNLMKHIIIKNVVSPERTVRTSSSGLTSQC